MSVKRSFTEHEDFKLEMDEHDFNDFEKHVVLDATWIRNHRTPRVTFFTPTRVAKGPKTVSIVGETRITGMRGNPCRVIIDNWMNKDNPHERVKIFEGFTAFAAGLPSDWIVKHANPRGGERIQRSAVQ